jgi:hypothetical protein
MIVLLCMRQSGVELLCAATNPLLPDIGHTCWHGPGCVSAEIPPAVLSVLQLPVHAC